jgi:hydroxypyruvate isomerase
VSLALSVNIELLFRESGDDPSERIRAAAGHGITVVEIWSHSDKDLRVIEKALAATGSTLHTLLIEGRLTLADAVTHEAFLGLVRAAAAAGSAAAGSSPARASGCHTSNARCSTESSSTRSRPAPISPPSAG